MELVTGIYCMEQTGESLPASVSKIGFPSWWLLKFKIEHLSFSVDVLAY